MGPGGRPRAGLGPMSGADGGAQFAVALGAAIL